MSLETNNQPSWQVEKMQNIPILSNSEIIKLFIEDMQDYSFACVSILKTIIWCILKLFIILSRFVISNRLHSAFYSKFRFWMNISTMFASLTWSSTFIKVWFDYQNWSRSPLKVQQTINYGLIIIQPKQVYSVVDEAFLAGEIRETSQQKILKQLATLNSLE